MINYLKFIKLNAVLFFRSLSEISVASSFVLLFSYYGRFLKKRRFYLKKEKKHINLRSNRFDYQVFAKIFVWKGYRGILSGDETVIIDAGGNIGLSALYFSSMAPRATVITLEPDKENFQKLKENTSGHERIVPLNVALASRSGKMNQVDNRSRPDGYRYKFDQSGDTKSITMQELLDSHFLESVDLFKMDIEGAEYDVLLNGDTAWLDHVKYVVCEFHDDPRKIEGKKKIMQAGFTHRGDFGEDSHFITQK